MKPASSHSVGQARPRRNRALAPLVLGLALVLAPPTAARATTWREAQARVVKVYGAGGLAGLEAYQSGVLISAEGLVLTVWSAVLDTDHIVVTLDDGRAFSAELWGADPGREIALVRLKRGAEEEASPQGLPHFRWDQPLEAAPGQRIWALSNLFGVAQGNEPVSVQHGVIAAIAPLAAQRGVFLSPYRGPAYLLDAMTNNPGAAGGALVDRQGRLLGLLGKELRSSAQGVWLNYALPIDELRETIAQLAEQRRPTAPAEPRPAGSGLTAEGLGIVLIPEVLAKTPSYVERVETGSPAAAAGLLPDDLLVAIGGQVVRSCQAAREALAAADPLRPLAISVLRREELVEMLVDPRRRQADPLSGAQP